MGTMVDWQREPPPPWPLAFLFAVMLLGAVAAAVRAFL